MHRCAALTRAVLCATALTACGGTEPPAPDDHGRHVVVQYAAAPNVEAQRAVERAAGAAPTLSSTVGRVAVVPTPVPVAALAAVPGVAHAVDYGADPDPAVSVFITPSRPAVSRRIRPISAP